VLSPILAHHVGSTQIVGGVVWTCTTPDTLLKTFHVAEPSAAEMEMLAAIPFEEEKMRANLGIAQFIRGLTGVEALKKHLLEDCLQGIRFVGELICHFAAD
jgi:hypothetical protein